MFRENLQVFSAAPFDFTVRRDYNILKNTSARRRLYERGQDTEETAALLIYCGAAGAAAVQLLRHAAAGTAAGGGGGLRHLHDHDRKQGDRQGGGGGQPDHLYQQGRQQDLQDRRAGRP